MNRVPAGVQGRLVRMAQEDLRVIQSLCVVIVFIISLHVVACLAIELEEPFILLVFLLGGLVCFICDFVKNICVSELLDRLE